MLCFMDVLLRQMLVGRCFGSCMLGGVLVFAHWHVEHIIFVTVDLHVGRCFGFARWHVEHIYVCDCELAHICMRA